MPPKSRNLLCCAVMLFCLSVNGKLLAQCTSSIAAPYFQDFEATNGGWFTGGSNSDWAWGTPAKPVINKAFSGSKCWITGGLAKSSYNNNESSYIQSPCFNLSALTTPYLSFKIFWETERGFDGAAMEYSIDSGKTFSLLGSVNDRTACPADNWYNTTSINTIGSGGWSGNIQPTSPCPNGAGGGQGQWAVAKHELSFLKGQTHVIFRFTFGAGNRCNDYDGFAIDDFSLIETPTSTANFTYNCSVNRTVQFNAADVICPATYQWNFGEPSSGSNNTSNSQVPAHSYAVPGNYNVSLQIIQSNAVVASLQQSIQVIDVFAGVADAVACNGNSNGTALVLITGPNIAYTYSWNTVPVQTGAMASNLKAGTYQVTVAASQTCTTTAFVTLTEPQILKHTITLTNPLCTANGRIAINTAGGTPNYNFTWQPNVANASTAANLAAGNYAIAIRDGNNCPDTARVTLVNQPNTLVINLGNDTTVCPGETVALQPGNFVSYLWQDQSVLPVYTVATTGDYSVTVTDNNGCTASDKIKVTVDCSDVFFPSAFTPNGDGKNETFGPIGNITALQHYSFKVYNRYGQPVFQTSNPYQKWNGTFNGYLLSGVYVWYAEYSILGRKYFSRKGTVYLMQ